jgi:hypothetical protein
MNERGATRILRVDVRGHVGMAEEKIYFRDKIGKTACILFFKFSNGWKVVSMVGLNHRYTGTVN